MIIRVNPQTPTADEIGGTRPSTADGDLFQKALTRAISETETPPSTLEPEATPSLGEIMSPERPLGFLLPSLQESTEDLIQKLDTYASRLGDSGTTLKQLAPLLDEMNANAQDLLRQTQADPEQDSRLVSLARESAIRASTEYIKFQRGDYL